MKCAKCDNPKALRAKYVEYDYSEKSGIKGCILEDVKQYKCPKCKTVYHDFGDLEEINMQIAEILAGANELTRAHVRWIRADYLGLTYFQFAKIVRVNPQFLRELEEFKRPITKEIQDIIQNHLAKKLLSKPIKIVFD